MNETNANPLSMDLSTIDTSMPLLAPDTYELRIVKVELTKTKDEKTPMLKVELKSTQPGRSVKGDSVGAGVVIFDQLMLAPRGKSTVEMVARQVAGLVQAVGGINGARLDNASEWHKQLEGQIVRAKVEYTAAGTSPTTGKSYPPKNEIGYYLKR